MYKNMTDSYSTYKDKWKDEVIPIKLFIILTGLFMKFIMKKVIDDSDEVVLPFKTGVLSVVGIRQKLWVDENGKIRGLSPNWRKTKELHDTCPECKKKRQIVYNTNEHSDGIRYKFHWTLAGILLKNKNFYNLKLCRANKRKLSAAAFNGKEYAFKELTKP